MQITLPTIVPGYGGTDQIALLDSLEEARGEFARAGLGENSGGALEKCAIGDSRYVEESDRLLDKFETGRFETKSFRTINDVAGGVPNIGAYLAGNPMAMRRRKRDASQSAPLTIVVDCGFSSMAYSEVVQRGAAILALVRILSAQRPVNLYIGDASTVRKPGQDSVAVMIKMETAPLDLARIGFALCNVDFITRLLYRYETFISVNNLGGMVGFPYGGEGYRRYCGAYWSRVIPGEVLAIPPMITGPNADHSIYKNSVKWLNTMLDKYGMQTPE